MPKPEPQPRSASFYGGYPTLFKLGTWLEPEAITYPSGAMIRRARVINAETGKLQVVRCGIPDTYSTIPVRGGGYLDITDGEILRFHPPSKKVSA